MSHTGSSGGGGSGMGGSKRAPRGAACLNCRRRKMRCDGTRPICLQCTRTGREADCEYTDGAEPSPTQVLEEQIARLESRIQELEHPELVAPAVTLNPAHTAAPRQTPVASPARPLLDLSRVGHPAPLHQAGAPIPALPLDPAVEPPIDLARTLLNTFLPCSSSLGFFLHLPRLMHMIQLPFGDPRRVQLPPALLNAIYLWGAHLSTFPNVRAYEVTFLERATAALTSSLRESPAVISLIQAEVLVANYFFTMSRFLEGRYHCSAAVALALSCRLTKIRSSTDHTPGFGGRQPLLGREYNLPPPRDAIEEGERVRGFWFVYALDKAWAVALGSPTHFNTGSPIDTPWPLEMVQYEAGGMPADFRGALTVDNFVAGRLNVPGLAGDSQLSLRGKAATLFERATYLSSQWSPTLVDRNEFCRRYMALDSLIDRFTASLPPVDHAGNPDTALTSLVTHTLARAATIQLRSNFKDQDRMNDRKDLVAAQAAAAAVEQVNIPSTNVDPILAILWTAVCRVLIGEILRATPAPPLSSFDPPASGFAFAHTSATPFAGPVTPPATATSGPPAQRAPARAMFDKVLGAMNRFRETCPLMGMIHDGFVTLQGAM